MTTRLKPHNVKQSDLTAEWHVIDARDKTLGRLSSEIATLLQGKHKPTYTPHLASGDFVVVVNADKFRVTGNKLANKMYYRHSGYHGGLTEQTLGDVLAKSPTMALKKAIKGMLPKNTLGKHMLSRLKLYVGEEHPHEAQINADEGVKIGKGANIARARAKAKAKTGKAPSAAEAPAAAPAAEAEPETTGAAEAPAAAEAPVAAEAGDDLSALTVAQLKELAGERGVELAAKARKADIIEALESAKTD
jgi:large subunit ribosomal protein L13